MQTRTLGFAIAALAAALPFVPPLRSSLAAEAAASLDNGAYEVVVNLDLPHLEGLGASRTATICVDNESKAPARGLVVLSENNPLAHCPASNVIETSTELKFEVHCEGKNAAEGHAAYTLLGDHFEGRIDMKMGGKNMTMTETQKGRRTGDCVTEKPRS